MSSSSLTNLVKTVVPERFHEFLRTNFLHPRQQRAASLSISEPRNPAVASPYPFAIDHQNPLEELGEKYGPTKRLHNYLVYYWSHFRDIRHQVRSFLEIGLETDRSIKMWEEFFPNAEIIGIDINPKCQEFEGGRRRIFIGDQSDPAFLDRVLGSVKHPFDVIIDDGSHLVQHQIASFNHLFPQMSSHGIYVVEDTGGVVKDFNLATCNAMKTLADHVMHWPAGFPANEWGKLSEFGGEASWLDKHVVGVAFYRWMIVIMKGRNPQDNPHLPVK